MENKEKIRKFRAMFSDHFNASLESYMDLMFGFDIVKFDEFLGTPDGISTKDFIEKKYGKEAMELIESLI